METITIPSSGATSGYYTVGGTTVKTSLESGWQTAGTVDASAKTLTMTNLADQTSITDETKGGWTITLGGKTTTANVKANDTVYGTTNADAVSIGGTNVHLELGNGADSVVSMEEANGAYVDAGAGDDSISISGTDVTVNGGTGADFISISGAKAQIDGGAGNDSIVAVGGTNDNITAGAGDDSVLGSITSGTVDLGSGNDFASLQGDSLTAYGQAGNDSISVSGSYVTVYGGEGNDSLVAAGEHDYVDGGDGNDFISIGGSNAEVYGQAGSDTIVVDGSSATVDAGAGNDSVVVKTGSATITLGDGRDTVSVGATGVSLQDYTYGTDVLVMGNGKGADSTKTGEVAFDTTGLVSVNGATATITSTNGYYKAALASATDGSSSMRYAWVSDTASTIDLSSETNPFYVVADLNDTTGDSILGGRGNDSIIVGSNDTVNGGRGKDSISIASGSTGVTVALSAGGSDDTVSGAESLTGFTNDALTLYVDDASKLGFTFGGTGNALKASIKGASAEFTSLMSTSGSGVDLKVDVAGTTTNYEIIADKAAIDEDASAIYGVAGAKASVTVGAGVGNSAIDLSNKKQFNDTHTYTNINYIDASASDGEDVLIGADTATTIAAGKGKTSLFGAGAAGDSLAGGDGDDTFFFGSGYGNDTIANYGKDGDDQIVLLSANTGFTKDNSGLHMAIGSDSLTVQNVSTTDTDVNNMVYTLSVYGEDSFTAKVGMTASSSNFTYDEDVAMYFGGSKTDTLTIGADESGDYQIWLGNTWAGKTYSSVEAINASNATGDLLLWGATDANSTITAGTGNDTLFGGFGSSGNDVLTGNSSGTATYEFGLGCGNDTIKSSKSTDSIYLYNVGLTDIDYKKTAAATTNSALNIVLTDGSTLTVSTLSTGVKTVVLGGDNNSTWTYSTTNKRFEQQ